MNRNIESANGNVLEAKIVFSKAIEYMKNHAMEHFRNSGIEYIEEETKWVVTVPAIFPDESKSLMRAAAEDVGCVNTFKVLY